MVKLLALLIAVTLSCGVAAAVTISLAPPGGKTERESSTAVQRRVGRRR
jgi:hypothetical protein